MFSVKLDEIKINGNSLGICKTNKCLITFDSGSSFLTVPEFAHN
jgi:hypothetical protein